MYAHVKQDLIEYVTEQKTTTESIERIKTFCQQQPPDSLVVYRGHKRSTEIRYNNFWYSASTNKDVAINEFSSGTCCVFTIHLINVPVININVLIGGEIGDYKEEQEYIFLGGGTFYADKKLTTKGFSNTTTGQYECWYTLDDKPPDNPTFNLDEILKIIPEEEYELIDSPSDIVVEGLSEEQKILVFNRIKKNGGRKSRKSKKIRKNRKSRKIRKSRKKLLSNIKNLSTVELWNNLVPQKRPELI